MVATSVRETDVSQGSQAFMNIVETSVAVAAVRRMSSASNALAQLGDDVAWVEAAVAAPGFFKAGHHVGNEVLDECRPFWPASLAALGAVGTRSREHLCSKSFLLKIIFLNSFLLESRTFVRLPSEAFRQAKSRVRAGLSVLIRCSLSVIRVVAQADQFRPVGPRLPSPDTMDRGGRERRGRPLHGSLLPGSSNLHALFGQTSSRALSTWSRKNCGLRRIAPKSPESRAS